MGILVTGGEMVVADTESYSSGEALRGSGVLRSDEVVRVSSEISRIPIAVKTLIRGDAAMTLGGARSTGTRMKERSKAKRFAVPDGGRRITIENERKSTTRSSASQAAIEAGRFVTHDQGQRMSSEARRVQTEASRTEQRTSEVRETTRRVTEAVIKGTLTKPPTSEALIEVRSERRGVPSKTTREPLKAAKPPVTEAMSPEGVSEEDMRELHLRNSLLMARLSVIGTSAFMSSLDEAQSSSSSSS